MARADRRRARAAAGCCHAAARSRDRGHHVLPRLRRQAKWVFLFLALVFGLGFVGFGVGAGGVGVGDIFREAVEAPAFPRCRRPRSASPRIPPTPGLPRPRDRAAGGREHGRRDRGALEQLVALRPKDVDALRELGSLYLAKADEAQQRAQIAQFRAAYLTPNASVTGLIQLDGKTLDLDPITSAVSGELSTEYRFAAADAQQASSKAVDRKIAAATPTRTSSSPMRHRGRGLCDGCHRLRGVPPARPERSARPGGEVLRQLRQQLTPAG